MKSLRPLSEGELAEWEEAYISVECYLRALQLRNRLLVADMVRAILFRASDRQSVEPHKTPRVLAMEETLKAVADWTQQVLDVVDGLVGEQAQGLGAHLKESAARSLDRLDTLRGDLAVVGLIRAQRKHVGGQEVGHYLSLGRQHPTR